MVEAPGDGVGDTSPPAGGESAGQITELILRKRSQDLGKIGSIFGSRQNAAVYLAAFMALVLLVLIGITMASAIEASVKLDLIKLFGSFFLATIGYLFGSLTAGD